jgi:hypothetical protein
MFVNCDRAVIGNPLTVMDLLNGTSGEEFRKPACCELVYDEVADCEIELVDDKLTFVPAHTVSCEAAAVTVGEGITLITRVTELEQPLTVTVYVIVAVPMAMPVTTPELLFTVAMLVLLLLQVPPLVASFRSSVFPWHTLKLPVAEVIAATGGGGFTVTVACTADWHPFAATPITVNVVVCAVDVRLVSAPLTEVVPPGPAGSIPTRSTVSSLVQL